MSLKNPPRGEHEGINPFTKEPMIYKAKAAHKVIKVRLLKALKDAV
jgi:DNA-binding protein HU-beta